MTSRLPTLCRWPAYYRFACYIYRSLHAYDAWSCVQRQADLPEAPAPGKVDGEAESFEHVPKTPEKAEAEIPPSQPRPPTPEHGKNEEPLPPEADSNLENKRASEPQAGAQPLKKRRALTRQEPRLPSFFFFFFFLGFFSGFI